MSDEIGSVMMDVEEELIIPDIPIRPNHSIPTVTAIILLIGAAMVAFAAYSAFMSDELYSEAEETQFAEQFTESEANVTQEDLEQYDDHISNSTYGTWSSALYSLSALSLLAGGVFLLKGDRRGIHCGVLGAFILISANLWGGSASKEAAMHLPEIASLTFATMYYIYACCGLFCMTLALMPMLFASGRAALTSPPTNLAAPSVGEEE
ncbi:MAG: hypothetical protein OSB33_04335 [Candidatus Poseidoniales archaeon]|nr:hypothetical protein [Candidatus Poseidoniales archaeon]